MRYVKLVRSKYHLKFDPNDFKDEIQFNKSWFCINSENKTKKLDYFYGPYTDSFNWMAYKENVKKTKKTPSKMTSLISSLTQINTD